MPEQSELRGGSMRTPLAIDSSREWGHSPRRACHFTAIAKWQVASGVWQVASGASFQAFFFCAVQRESLQFTWGIR